MRLYFPLPGVKKETVENEVVMSFQEDMDETDCWLQCRLNSTNEIRGPYGMAGSERSGG